MSKKEQGDLINAKFQLGLIAAYKAMLAFKAYKNSPVIIARGGQIVAVPAAEMPPAPTAEK
ncbi:hypothetical protein [uncultured Hymenobacter sp.]|uniref:hypothetical protein n=1 Tax=uncultured Hymenobacter sp. TaxID=170016 RepID=UPI0035CBB479